LGRRARGAANKVRRASSAAQSRVSVRVMAVSLEPGPQGRLSRAPKSPQASQSARGRRKKPTCCTPATKPSLFRPNPLPCRRSSVAIGSAS
jgi:hypothetical protein